MLALEKDHDSLGPVFPESTAGPGLGFWEEENEENLFLASFGITARFLRLKGAWSILVLSCPAP